MNRRLLFALALVTASGGTIPTAMADSAHRRARRQAIVAGSIRNQVATERAHERYQQCVRGSGYDTDCERQLYRDEQNARARGRRTAIIVGAGR